MLPAPAVIRPSDTFSPMPCTPSATRTVSETTLPALRPRALGGALVPVKTCPASEPSYGWNAYLVRMLPMSTVEGFTLAGHPPFGVEACGRS